MKRKQIYFAIVILVGAVLSACSTQSGESTPTTEILLTIAQPSKIPNPTETSASSPTNTPEPTNTSTPDHTPYPTKQVLFNYSVSGGMGPFDGYLDWHWSRLVLYADGQLIIKGHPYQQKMLSPAEIDQFMSELEQQDFFVIETNQAHDPSDPMYDFGDQYSKTTGGIYYYVTVTGARERDICIYGVYRDFLIPEMENVLTFLDEYQPAGMSIYHPDRILLHVLLGRNPFDDTPDEAIPWPDYLPSLDTPGKEVTFIQETLDEKILFFEGEDAKEIYEFWDDTISGSVFSQNGIEYTIILQVVLPHKDVSYP